jgi:superfamily I DNA and/or RNA helicase
MYDGKLISHESVRHRKLSSLSQVEERMNTEHSSDNAESPQLENVTLMIIDTTGCGYTEMTTSAGSRYNEGEAELVASHVQLLLSLGLRAEDIAVITP